MNQVRGCGLHRRTLQEHASKTAPLLRLDEDDDEMPGRDMGDIGDVLQAGEDCAEDGQ